MRRLFGMLRTEGEQPGLALAPQPGLGELERLVRQVDSARDAGPACASRATPSRSARASTSRRTGSPRRGSPTPCGTRDATARSVSWCATRRGGSTSRSRTTVAACPSTAANGHGPHGGGHGLVGIRERVGALRRDRRPRALVRPAGVRLAASLPLKEARHDHPTRDRRRPGHGPGGLPLAARRRARLRGRRRGRPTARRRVEVVAAAGPGRHPDGHPDARARRHRRHPPDSSSRGVETKRAGADHLRPRRVRLRGAARRCLRLPAQGRPGRGARRTRSGSSRRGSRCSRPVSPGG